MSYYPADQGDVMTKRRGLLMLQGFGIVWLAASPVSAQDKPPVFKTGVELVTVDAQVVDKKGTPIPALRPEQFQVSIDGKRRTVVSAELVDANTGLPFPATGPAPAAPADATRPPVATPTPNIYVLAVDQGSFRAVNAPSVIYAAREFLKRALPNDYVGMVSFPAPGVVVNPTRNRAELETAIPRLVGFSAIKQLRKYQYTLADAIDVAARDARATQAVVQRNCQPNDLMCGRDVENELTETVSILEMQSARSLAGIRDVIASIKGIPGRKTLVVLSAGIPSGDRTGGRLYMRNDAVQGGKEAADAGILLYTLHLNSAFLDSFSPDAPSAQQTAMREANVYAKGLETFNGTAGGTFMEVSTGPDFAIARMMLETSAYYLLGVEVQDADRDGKTHRIQVKVDHKNSSVRSRPTFVIPKK
jgi:VWFA-related protein